MTSQGGGPHVRQHPTHVQLIGRAAVPAAERAASPALDAIVIPASRPAENLEHAVTLAQETGCHLVILCSRQAYPADVHRQLPRWGFSSATVIEIPERYDHDLFDFKTTWWVRNGPGKDVCVVRDSDLSIKRNVGLALARMLGWERMFFMDDDIIGVDADALRRTVSLLGGAPSRDVPYYSAGMTVKEFPDNSVVCHARRHIGEYQDVFLSGSVLAVDCTAPLGFFPDIYNEDWLFFYHDAATGRLGSSGVTATQISYDPFADPMRAAGQEFGDIIAEGLYALLHRELGTKSATPEYWRQFLSDRKRILDHIISDSYKAPSEMRNAMIKAVATAGARLPEITPEMCVQYVETWQSDLTTWTKKLASLPNVTSVEEALGFLELA
jgi:hypothetical protein